MHIANDCKLRMRKFRRGRTTSKLPAPPLATATVWANTHLFFEFLRLLSMY